VGQHQPDFRRDLVEASPRLDGDEGVGSLVALGVDLVRGEGPTDRAGIENKVRSACDLGTVPGVSGRGPPWTKKISDSRKSR
jgi:hypothetical protein